MLVRTVGLAVMLTLIFVIVVWIFKQAETVCCGLIVEPKDEMMRHSEHVV